MLSLNPPADYDRETSLRELRPLIEGMLLPEGFFAAYDKIWEIIHRHDGNPHNWSSTPKNEIGWMGNINGEVVIFSITLYEDGRPGKNALIVKGRMLKEFSKTVDSYAVTFDETTVICQDLRLVSEDDHDYDSKHPVDVIVQVLLQLRDAK